MKRCVICKNRIRKVYSHGRKSSSREVGHKQDCAYKELKKLKNVEKLKGKIVYKAKEATQKVKFKGVQ